MPSTMTATISNVFGFDRHRARFASARLENEEDDPAQPQRDDLSVESPSPLPSTASSTATTTSSSSSRSATTIASRDGVVTSAATAAVATAAAAAAAASVSTVASDDDIVVDRDLESAEEGIRSSSANTTSRREGPRITVRTSNNGTTTATTTTSGFEVRPSARTVTIRNSMTLAELEEERELARRRSSACVLLGVFVLFRLWISAIQNGDFGILLLCLVGTSWTARWIRHNREREEELDRRIANFSENPDGSGSSTTEVDRHELRMLSFQAQLALAIMESQRQMMQGGYGHPDGQQQGSSGVSDATRNSWERMSFRANEKATGSAADTAATTKGGYGSVSQGSDDSGKGAVVDEEPHCSICLSEYEDGEKLVKLPCSHVYHEDCISAWTTNHVKCPLCNLDLEGTDGEGDDSGAGVPAASTATVDVVV